MFSRSSKRNRKKPVVKAVVPANIKIIEPEQTNVEKPAIDLNKAKITVTEPEGGLMIKVNKEGEEDK